MSENVAIAARGLGKRFLVYESERARLIHALLPDRGHRREVWALRDVSLQVARGESVGVIGRNGSGKSTLLQILAGTLPATSGEVRVHGRVCALLELGSGFDPQYTGRDNVVLNGLLLGLSRREILRRFDEIAAFAEIGDAIDRPVKTYSSGMVMRLAFAVQVLMDPDILIVDEALSVGDFFFQQKCYAYIRSLVERGVTLLFVSHDLGAVRDICSRAIYLREGRVEYDGEARLAIRRYLEESGATPAPASAGREPSAAAHGELQAILRDAVWTAIGSGASGTGPALLAVALYDREGRPSSSFTLGETMRVKVAYRPGPQPATHVAALIRNRYDQVVTSTGSSRLGLEPPTGGESIAIFDLEIDMRLEAGNYSLTVGLSRLTGPNHGENLDSSPPIGPIAVRWDYERDVAPFLGMVGLENRAAFRIVPRAAGVAA